MNNIVNTNNDLLNNNNGINVTPVKNNNIPNNIKSTTNKVVLNKEENKKNAKLIRYKYKVKDKDNKIIESYFDAENRLDVESFLLNKRYEIISITEDKLSTSLGLTSVSSQRKMKAKELDFFLTQLSTYIKSGIPLLDSMEILSRQTKNKTTQMLYKKIVFNLNKGLTFSDCLEKEGKVFPKMLINMLKTSEMTGDLTGVLDDMAAYYKRQDMNRKEIINAMTYPSVLLIFALAVLTFVITYIVPSFTSMYDAAGAGLPKITLVVMNISNFVIDNWIILLAGLVGIILLFVFLYKISSSSRKSMQSFVMHIPVIKDIVIYNQVVTFTSTFATLIRHDVFITDSMEILKKITENEVYKRIINDAINNLSVGNGVSIAFKNKWAFPQTAYEMLVTGEKTGKLGEMMEHVANYYQAEQTNIIARLKSLIEPVMIILLAALVGIILLSIVYPMFDIYSKMI